MRRFSFWILLQSRSILPLWHAEGPGTPGVVCQPLCQCHCFFFIGQIEFDH
jgi:hypothetical protein